MTKGICDLRKFLHKAQVRLTKAGSLIIGHLGITKRNLLWLRHLGNFYFVITLLNRFPPRPFCAN